MRLDRFLSVHIARPLVRMQIRAVRSIPILMYHGIRPVTGPRRPYRATCTAPEVFAAHLQFLAEAGYRGVSLKEAISSPPAIEKMAVLTFDDGFDDFYRTAFPQLARHRFSATLFVVSTFAASGSRRPADFATDCFLDWSEIRALDQAGIEIGSHTATHPRLWTMSARARESELRTSKAEIENAIGRPVESFAHPFAFPEQSAAYASELCGLLRDCGYRAGVSTRIGIAQPAPGEYLLPRLPVNTYDDLALLAAKLEGGYNWLEPIQRHYKRHLKPLFPHIGSHPRGEVHE
ncbi:MAG: polysaccharide deacetylase family protein [Acidobacteriaceae bacterium]|nr:polysaccharide deacetylase family protein [Acidobacteriaceae bacterium]